MYTQEIIMINNNLKTSIIKAAMFIFFLSLSILSSAQSTDEIEMRDTVSLSVSERRH